jgi:hypothetical protein
MSFMLILFGVDRMRIFETLQTQIAELKEQLVISRHARVITKNEWEVSLPLILESHQRLDVIQFGGPKAPDDWRRAVAKHICKRRSKNPSLKRPVSPVAPE